MYIHSLKACIHVCILYIYICLKVWSIFTVGLQTQLNWALLKIRGNPGPLLELSNPCQVAHSHIICVAKKKRLYYRCRSVSSYMPMICPHMIPTLRVNPPKLMVQTFFFMCSMAIKRRSRPTSNTPMYHIVGTIMYNLKCFPQCVAVRCCYLVVIWGPLGMRDGYQQAIRNQSFWWLAVFLSIFMFMVSLGSLNCTR